MKDIKKLLQPVDPRIYMACSDLDDQRFGDTIQHDHNVGDLISSGDFVLLGFPQDRGVVDNKGRPGASKSPDLIRHYLSRFVALSESSGSKYNGFHILDLGNVLCDENLEESQDRLGRVLSHILSLDAFPVIIGGGHETTLGHFLGYVGNNKRVRIISIDAHFDVRQLRNGRGHSGSHIRQIMEHPSKCLKEGGYYCIGVQHSVNSRSSYEFIEHHGAAYTSLEDLLTKPLSETIDAYLESIPNDDCILLTVDLDSIRQSDAPGVSAPSPIGLPAEKVVSIVRRIAIQRVGSIDVSECNQRFDRDGQTARLAAIIIYEFISSLLQHRLSV